MKNSCSSLLIIFMMIGIYHSVLAQPTGIVNWNQVPEIIESIREPVFPLIYKDVKINGKAIDVKIIKN
ncbi:MAG: hypothetical protein WD059_02755 [Balneolaceae bacterium]